MSDEEKLTPIAWVMPIGDRPNDNGFLDAMAWQEGEFSCPLCSLEKAAAMITRLAAENESANKMALKAAETACDIAKKRYEDAEVIARLAADKAKLVEALSWYGENARLARLIHAEGDKGRHAISADGGSRARAAIEETTNDPR